MADARHHAVHDRLLRPLVGYVALLVARAHGSVMPKYSAMFARTAAACGAVNECHPMISDTLADAPLPEILKLSSPFTTAGIGTGGTPMSESDCSTPSIQM